MSQRLAELSLDQRKAKSILIQRQLMTYLNEIHPTSLCVFISTALEPYLDLTVLAGLVPDLYCPKYVDNGYVFVRFSADMNLVDGPYGIKEPESALVIEDDVYLDKGTMFLVPGMAFSESGERLGHGKGIYDRLLAEVNGLKVGLCFDVQLTDECVNQEHDIRMDKVFSGL